MILVSMYVEGEKLFIEVKHRTIYQVEKKFATKKNQKFNNFLLFSHLFISVIKLGCKELYESVRSEKLVPKTSEIPVNYIEGK